MGIFDIFRPKNAETVPQPKNNVTLSSVLDTYDVVSVVAGENPYMVVADRNSRELRESQKRNIDEQPSFGEIGSTNRNSITMSTREYNFDLQGRKGLEVYDRMRRSDGIVKGLLLAVKTPPLAGRWFINPASQSKKDRDIANFVWKNLTELMSSSFSQVRLEALLHVDFGNYGFEKVWEEAKVDGKDRIILRKLSPRHPMSVKEWIYDAYGGPEGVVFYKSKDSSTYDGFNGYTIDEEVTIPISKLLWFTNAKEDGNMEGISVLRNAYKHWYFIEQLYKIDAIQKERHGIGIPVIKLPPNFTALDKATADQLGRNLRTNESAHVVLPINWEIIFAKLEGQPVNVIESIQMHATYMRESVLAEFLSSDPSSEVAQDLFLKSSRFIADAVCDSFNLYLIPQMVRYNFDTENMPKLAVRRVGEQTDGRTLSFALRNLIGAGILSPDDRLEEHIREEMDLPDADRDTARVLPTPQNPNPQDPNEPQPGNKPQVIQETKPDHPQPRGVVNSNNLGKQNINKNRVGLPRQTLPTPRYVKRNGGNDASGGK